MRLFVVGNISSGKSYIIDKIKPLLPNYHILKIDDYRANNCDGTLEKELQMWREFPNEVLKYNDVIVELSGGGQVASNIVKQLEENSFLVLFIDVNSDVCIERSKTKDFKRTPYPKEFKEPIEETIKRLGKNFETNINKVWSKALNIIKIDSNVDVTKLPLLQYHELFKLKETLVNYEGSLFTFGTTARGLMDNSSDVDTYFLCKERKEKIKQDLSSKFDSVKIMQDEFVIRENGILVEMNYINDINKALYFYGTSLVKNPYKTILKDDYGVIYDLIVASKIEVDKNKIIDFTIDKLDYYVESLPRITLKNDEYKYYFHNNIVIHEYVKLRAFLKDEFAYSYLPKDAKKYLTEEEWINIMYSFGDDMIKHYEVVRKMSDEIINEVRNKYDKK
ncbi:MAG: hypothetical protein J5656_01105 [Clostridia bacterium]|nr:hypothetical protein [Clostridia bacterium]